MNNIVVSIFLQQILEQVSLAWQEKKIHKSNNYLPDVCSLKLNKNNQKITFNSAICLKLAQYYSLNPLDIAEDFIIIYEGLVLNHDLIFFSASENKLQFAPSDLKGYSENLIINNNVLSICDDPLHKFYFTLNISGNGWLELTLTDEYLRDYLFLLSNYNFTHLVSKQNKISADFEYIYIHSRFCSILRSAHDQGIINLNDFDFHHNWGIQGIDRNIFNYLITEKKDCLGIIKTIIYCLENGCHNQKKQYLTMIKVMCQALYKWEKRCSIWGAIKDDNLPLAQGELALSAIALKYYQSLCKLVFTEDFPIEL
ncbi:hypothetical protein Cyast_1672 [Cyanobacterium stanieri PCC 7202]|uniref:DALR anticodon binding domain protein n=1 Tax=Cyanobacterium stanieri (strain ATCC 29140 / PCC 7202) TaxID=292563 RepID=K9YMD4_CYASC|nr:hypothetical protein Cyast_1672 [Cyanobacterium stanieri PCC 7202]